MVRFAELTRYMGYSKPSISHAVYVLKNGDYLTMNEQGYLHLTSNGKQ
ncbi:hypothetical protein NSA52_00440 [Clostridium sporogenes]|nr:hypothetical protein [Clostridium sporogenes]MCR1972597.1 hypothetical protein [Clostridium sporogenes]